MSVFTSWINEMLHGILTNQVFLFFIFFYNESLWELQFCLLFYFIYLFIIYGCFGSSFLCEGFLLLWQVGATLHRGARASHYRGFSRCGAQAPDAQAQHLWLTGPAAPRRVGSSQTRARTRAPALAGRFSTTVPPGKPVFFIFY